MFPRTVEHFSRSTNSTTRSCDAPGCSATTREGKPYCPDHVEQHPYVQSILDLLTAREEEEASVRSRGARAVDPDGLTARELLLHLSLHGARTLERLSRELQLEMEILKGYISALESRQLINLGRTHRGSTVVRLGAAEDEKDEPSSSRRLLAIVA